MTTTTKTAATLLNAAGQQALTPAPRYGVIAADPPWDVQQKGGLGAEKHYDLMTLDQIKAMGEAVRALAEDNAHLYLWVTNATLRVGYDVMEAWGFTPRSPLTWVKPRFTLGNYLRNATEHVLFAARRRSGSEASRPGSSRRCTNTRSSRTRCIASSTGSRAAT